MNVLAALAEAEPAPYWPADPAVPNPRRRWSAGPLRRLRHFVVPVYDYALVTEPLSADRHQGRRNLWLRTLDHLGVGFDS